MKSARAILFFTTLCKRKFLLVKRRTSPSPLLAPWWPNMPTEKKWSFMEVASIYQKTAWSGKGQTVLWKACSVKWKWMGTARQKRAMSVRFRKSMGSLNARRLFLINWKLGGLVGILPVHSCMMVNLMDGFLTTGGEFLGRVM